MAKKWLYHPFEIALCGFSGAGKTTLIEKLIKELSVHRDVGYVKHDAHRFQMDREGKDTWRASQAGASSIFISNQEHFAHLGAVPPVQAKTLHLDRDMVLIEGHKKSPVPKIWVGPATDLDQVRELEEVRAWVAPAEDVSTLKSSFEGPVFSRDDIEAIVKTIQNHFDKQLARPLKGLVLTGGQSRRMGRDKGALKYGKVSQTRRAYDLLSAFCSEVYVSCRQEQQEEEHLRSLPQVWDRHLGMGPAGGILSAMATDREAAWLVLACDLPFLQEDTLERLTQHRDPYKMATCFLNPEKRWPEPLCTIWEPKAYTRLFEYIGLEKTCPRKVLFNSAINALELENSKALANVNTPEEFESSYRELRGETK